jgi:hypothetical protein
MEIEEGSRDITSFSVPGLGSYRFKRLSFGLKTAPACFQREMEVVLKDFLKNKIEQSSNNKHSDHLNKSLKNKLCSPSLVQVYLDDILVMGENFESHFILLDKVLSRLEERGLKSKITKMFLGCALN